MAWLPKPPYWPVVTVPMVLPAPVEKKLEPSWVRAERSTSDRKTLALGLTDGLPAKAAVLAGSDGSDGIAGAGGEKVGAELGEGGAVDLRSEDSGLGFD